MRARAVWAAIGYPHALARVVLALTGFLLIAGSLSCSLREVCISFATRSSAAIIFMLSWCSWVFCRSCAAFSCFCLYAGCSPAMSFPSPKYPPILPPRTRWLQAMMQTALRNYEGKGVALAGPELPMRWILV